MCRFYNVNTFLQEFHLNQTNITIVDKNNLIQVVWTSAAMIRNSDNWKTRSEKRVWQQAEKQQINRAETLLAYISVYSGHWVQPAAVRDSYAADVKSEPYVRRSILARTVNSCNIETVRSSIRGCCLLSISEYPTWTRNWLIPGADWSASAPTGVSIQFKNFVLQLGERYR